MISISVQKSADGIGLRLNQLSKDLNQLPAQTTAKLKELTPIDTGNARRKTQLKNKTTIKADYEYATALDNGHSQQAPIGMTKPLFVWLKNKTDLIILRKV
jgi:hypothetical protein